MSICGNCYFILTLLGVCHVKVNFVCPLINGDFFNFMCGICYVTSRQQLAFVSCFVMSMAETFHMPTRIHQKSKNSKK